MEEFLNRVHALKDCYAKYSYEDVISMDKKGIQTLCLEQKIALNEHLHSDKMSTRNITTERLNIIKEQTAEEKAKRLEYLNKTFGKN